MNLATETAFTGADAVAAQPPLTPAELAPHFPQLEILECLGRGGMGVVYKARQKSLNRIVALKLLAPERVQDPEFARRFAREAQALAALSHTNIVTIHDFGQAGGFYFLLMEFVDGVNLRQLLRSRKLTPEEALAIVPPLCDALQYAHDRGIVHRDIKPENLLLDKQGHVNIADFGIARMLGGDAPASGSGDDKAVGTPGYMAPEQKRTPQLVDSRADIYSLGVVFYEMLTGELPGAKLQPPSRKVQVDVRLDEIVLRALEEKPELRFATATQFRTQVEAVVANGRGARAAPVAAVIPTSRFTLARVGVIAGVAAALVFLLFVGAVFLGFVAYLQARSTAAAERATLARAVAAEQAAIARAAHTGQQQEASRRDEAGGLIAFSTNQTAGIGVALAQKGDHIVVGKILPNTPASRDGQLKVGDRVMCVEEEGRDYVQLDGMALGEAVKLTRGKEGSVVTLHMVPQGKTIEERIKIKLTRERLTSVETEATALQTRLAQYERAFAVQTAVGANQAVDAAALAKLSYTEFDQTPGQGWRALAEQKRFVEAARMIENYLTVQTNLSVVDRANLHFHAAQCLAFAGDTKDVLDALAHLKRAYHTNEMGGIQMKEARQANKSLEKLEQKLVPPPDWPAPLRWNDYVSATEAFLKGDLAALKAAREKIAAAPRLIGDAENLEVVDRLIANFGKPYAEAYGTAATAPTRLEF